MSFGKNLENLDSAMDECDYLCFGPLGPMLYQADIPWMFSWALAYWLGMSFPLEQFSHHCTKQYRMMEQLCNKRFCPLVAYYTDTVGLTRTDTLFFVYSEITSLQLNTNRTFFIIFLFLCWQLHAMHVSVPSSSSLSLIQLHFTGGRGALLDAHFKAAFSALNCPLWQYWFFRQTTSVAAPRLLRSLQIP